MTQRLNIFRRTKYFYTYDKIYFTLPSSSVLISPSLSLSKSAKASLRHSISLAPICLSGLDQSEMSIALCLDQWEVTWPGPPWRQLITPRTRPPLLAPVLAIVTPHSNISLVLLSTIYNIYYIYYLLRTPELEQEHLQQIRYLNSLILRTNRISSSFTDADITSSDILVAVPSYPHPLSSQQILYTLLGTLSTPSRNREGAKYM